MLLFDLIKKPILYVLVLAFLAACSGQNNDNEASKQHAEIEPIAGEFCFLQISGIQNKDSLAVNIDIQNQQVSGTMSYKIYEKDARQGTLEGELIGNVLKALWTFQQEGVTDTLNLEFQLDSNLLRQRPLVFNTSSQRQQTDYTSSDWVIIPKVDCGNASNKSFKVSGVVEETSQGKDGYTASLKGDDGKPYTIMMSIINLKDNYTRFNPGDNIEVAGDTIHLGDKIQVQVKKFVKK